MKRWPGQYGYGYYLFSWLRCILTYILWYWCVLMCECESVLLTVPVRFSDGVVTDRTFSSTNVTTTHSWLYKEMRIFIWPIAKLQILNIFYSKKTVDHSNERRLHSKMNKFSPFVEMFPTWGHDWVEKIWPDFLNDQRFDHFGLAKGRHSCSRKVRETTC